MIIMKRHDKRFKRAATEAAKRFGETLKEIWIDPMTFYDGHRSCVEVWSLKSGKFLTVAQNDNAFSAAVTVAAPGPKGRLWEKADYYDICDAAGIQYDFMPALRELEEIRKLKAMK